MDRAHLLAASCMGLLVACGARTELSAPDVGTGGAGASGSTTATTGGERTCPPDCTIGHRCCIGGCSGPAAKTVNDCCACLPGEVNSMQCPDHQCGN